MSMVINLVEDHNIYLCEGGPVYNGGVQPTPITYLTQWKIVGNSEVHTLPYPDGVVLPNGYKRCEYLQSDGTAYIELPFGFDNTDEVYAKVSFLNASQTDKCFVTPKQWNTDNNRFGMGILRASVGGDYVYRLGMFYGGLSRKLSPELLSDTAIHEWQYKDYVCSVGASSFDFTNPSFGSETANLRLFYGYNTPTECKICEYRHKKANAEYRLIPCLDSNDTPCMYDVINNQAYYNSASTGSFTYKLYPQPTEIWSCGEYNSTDGKWHILVQPLGGSVADIALTEPLRKVNDVADTIEFPSDTEGKALVTRNLALLSTTKFVANRMDSQNKLCLVTSKFRGADYDSTKDGDILCNKIEKGLSLDNARKYDGECFALQMDNTYLRNGAIEQTLESYQSYFDNLGAIEVVYQLASPTTELVDAPQIAEADSYTCVISLGAKAVEWSSFETE